MKKQLVTVAVLSAVILGLSFVGFTLAAQGDPITGIVIGLEGDPAPIAGDPIHGTDVGLEGEPGDIVIQTATTDDKGQFTFSNLAAGQYKLKIMPSKEGQAGTSQNYSSAQSSKAVITTDTRGVSEVKIAIKLLATAENQPVAPYILTIGPKGGKISGTVNVGTVPVTLNVTAQPAITITPSDLGVNVGRLPTSYFYFLTEWGRAIQRFFTFDSVAKAELELKITNEKAAEALAVEKANPDNAGALKNALQNYTNEQGRLNAQLAGLTGTSTNPKVSDLLKKVDETSAKQAVLLNQLTEKHIGQPKYEDITGVADSAQNNIQQTFTNTLTVSATPGGSENDVKQKVADQIARAEEAIKKAETSVFGQPVTFSATVINGGDILIGVTTTAGLAVDDCNSVLQGVSTTRSLSAPLPTGGGPVGPPSLAGDPIPGVDVNLGKNPGGSIATTTSTGADGTYKFTGLLPGTYDLSVAGQIVKTVIVGAEGTINGKVSSGCGKAGLAADDAITALQQVSTTRSLSAPLPTGGGPVGPPGAPISTTRSNISRPSIIIANAKNHLESAKEAFAAAKYGEAYGLARSVEAMVAGVTFTPSLNGAESATMTAQPATTKAPVSPAVSPKQSPKTETPKPSSKAPASPMAPSSSGKAEAVPRSSAAKPNVSTPTPTSASAGNPMQP